MDIHCVVTGQNESGKSVIVRNTPVKPVSLALLQIGRASCRERV